MQPKTVLVSSNNDIIEQIEQACEESGLGSKSLIVLKEASANAVRDLMNVSGAVGAVIVDLSSNEKHLEILISLRASHPDLVLGAAHPAPSAELLLTSMRSGGFEFLTPPFELERLRRGTKEPVKVSANGKLIAFIPAQSGNGASTAALHAAYAASRELDDKVLLIELDFHCSVLRERLKIEAKGSIADILEKTDQLDALWADVVHPWNGIDLLPSPASSRAMACKSLQRLPEILDYAVSRYKAVIVDLPSALMTSTREILTIADELYLLCTPEVTSLHLARRRASELLELGIERNVLRIIVNRAGSAQSLQTHELSQVIGLPIHKTLDNDYVALHDSWAQAKLLTRQDPLGNQLYDLGAALVKASRPVKSTQRQTWKALLSVFH